MTGDKATRYLILLLALALAAYGQHIIDSREAFGSGWPVFSWFNDELTRIYQREQSVALAIPLLGFGAWFFVESIQPLLPARPSEPGLGELPPRSLPTFEGTPEQGLVALLAALSLATWGFVVVQLATNTSLLSNWWLFWGALTGVGVAFAIPRRGVPAKLLASFRWHPLEYVFAAVLAGFFIGLMTYDLDKWTYAHIGDEGVFWDIAKAIANGTNERNYFTYAGANGYHPMFSSVYQGYVMKVAGVDMFGWKLSNVLSIAAALPVFYWLMRTAFNIRTALFAAAVMATCHVLFAYAHTGYDNALAILPSVTALGLFVAGWRSREPLLFVLSGIAAGLCFYTFYTARATIFIIALFALSEYIPHWWRTRSFRGLLDGPLPFAIGFVLAVVPIFAVDGLGVITATDNRSLFSDVGWVAGLGTMIDNIPRAFLAFSFWPADHHYVSGSFLDEISAVLAILGFGYTLANFKRPMYRLLLIWFLVVVITAGVLHEHARTEMPSRLNFGIPPAAALAGVAVDKLIVAFARLYPRRWSTTALTAVAFVVLVPSIFGFNAYRFYVATPKVHVLTPAAVVYRESTSPACSGEEHFNIVIARSDEQGSIEDVFNWYAKSDRAPVFIAYQDPDMLQKRQQIFEDSFLDFPVACIMFTVPEDDAGFALIQSFEDELDRWRGDWVTATDPAGSSEVVVLNWLSKARTPRDEQRR